MAPKLAASNFDPWFKYSFDVMAKNDVYRSTTLSPNKTECLLLLFIIIIIIIIIITNDRVKIKFIVLSTVIKRVSFKMDHKFIII